MVGVCVDGNGAPKKGVTVTGSEVRASPLVFFMLPVLPEIRPLAKATSDSEGKFSLKLRSHRAMLVDLVDASWQSAFRPGQRLVLPDDKMPTQSLFLSVVVEDGCVTGTWQTPNKAAW